MGALTFGTADLLLTRSLGRFMQPLRKQPSESPVRLERGRACNRMAAVAFERSTHVAARPAAYSSRNEKTRGRACTCLPEFSGPDYFAFLFSLSIRTLAVGPDDAGFWPVISVPSTTV